MSQYWSELTKGLDPYIPGEQPQLDNIIKLNTNENPFPPSAQVLAAINSRISGELRKYPDPNAAELKAAIADWNEIEARQVFVGNGSDEVLAHVFAAFFKGKKRILFPDITYSFYPVYCRLFEVESRQIPLNARFEIEVDKYSTENGGIIFPNPNAPTGVFLDLERVEELLRANSNVVVVIDEAYVDFGGQSCLPLIDKYPNLLVVQTLSKSRSLAGLRVGFACGNAELIEGLERVKNSFNSYPLDRLAISAAVASFLDKDSFTETTEMIIQIREFLSIGLRNLGFEVLPSKANFVFATHEIDAEYMKNELRKQSIVVRHFKAPRINRFLRISIGSYPEMKTLLAALKVIIKEATGRTSHHQ